MRVVTYLSPHLDDVTLSCGGRLWVEQLRGVSPQVITLCAGIPDGHAESPFATVQHQKWGSPPRPMAVRRAEDLAALVRLGIERIVHLDFLDAVYRLASDGSPLYGSEEAIFGEPDPREAQLPLAMVDALTRHIPAGSEVIAPLGIGHHVDHLLVGIAAQHLADRGYQVSYYEDLPYAATPGALERALIRREGWTSETLPLDEAALATKVSAVSYYRTQIPVIFGDDLTMSRVLRGYAAAVAHPGSLYGERIWRPGRSPRSGDARQAAARHLAPD
jgi:LmbE family N-acetylglucosaminyl deacetylase